MQLMVLTATEQVAALSPASIALILAPSTLALIGVIAATGWTARQSRLNERLRAQASIANDLFAERRRAELAALRLVAETTNSLSAFHGSMFGNTGEGTDDETSAAAITAFGATFDRLLRLDDCAVELAAYGSAKIAAKVEEIAFNIRGYVDSWSEDMPHFVARKAVDFEKTLDGHFKALVGLVREDFGLDAAHVAVWGTKKP